MFTEQPSVLDVMNGLLARLPAGALRESYVQAIEQHRGDLATWPAPGLKPGVSVESLVREALGTLALHRVRKQPALDRKIFVSNVVPPGLDHGRAVAGQRHRSVPDQGDRLAAARCAGALLKRATSAWTCALCVDDQGDGLNFTVCGCSDDSDRYELLERLTRVIRTLVVGSDFDPARFSPRPGTA